MNVPADRWPDYTPQVAPAEIMVLPASALDTGERRLEGETYLTGGYGLRVLLASSFEVVPLESLAKIWQPYRLRGTQVGADEGLPFLTATQVFDTRPVPRKWVAPSKTPDLKRRLVEPGWLLVTCSGTVGDPIITFAPHVGAVISHDLLRVQVHEPTDLGYLYTFLRCRFGRTILRSTKYGSIVKHLEPEHLLDVPVPRLDDSIVRALDETIRHVFDLRQTAFELTLDSERLYAAQFPSIDDDPAPDPVFEVAASQMFGGARRLDGYHYNPRATGVLAAIQASQTETVPLEAVTKSVFGVPRFKHVYQDEGISYLDSEDLFKLNPEVTKFIPEATKSDASRYYVERGWLLMACSGQIYGLNGSVVIADSWHENKIVSNHVLRIVPEGIRPGFLAMALGHPTLGCPLVLRLAFGSEIPEIAPQDLLSLPIARLGAVEDEIANRMEEASSLRTQADSEEDQAVLYLEEELDTGLSPETTEKPTKFEKLTSHPAALLSDRERKISETP
jgi:type I restriction enzyme S subunit